MAPYPFCTIRPNTGVVPVPDLRLARLGQLLKPQRLTPASIEFVDVAGLIEGASRCEDVEVVETELLLADLEVLGRQRLRVEKRAQAGDKAAAQILPTLIKVEAGLLKVEGRDYLVADGDILLFRFQR